MTSDLTQQMLRELKELETIGHYRRPHDCPEVFYAAFTTAVKEWIDNQPDVQHRKLAQELADKNPYYLAESAENWVCDAEKNDVYYVERLPTQTINQEPMTTLRGTITKNIQTSRRARWASRFHL